jgi:hypothetical protein
MSANQHPTEKLSQYVDLHLNKHVANTNSYIKDSSHFIDICNSIDIQPGDRLVTFDVTALYTNIPHDEGVAAVEEFLTPKIGKEKAEMIAQLTKEVLKGNIFEFNKQLYIQTSGTAMGTKLAPAFANLYLHTLEMKHLPNAPTQPKLWKRYIDDIFCIIQATDDELKEFLHWLNSIHHSIKFTMDASTKGIPFLDMFLTIKDQKINIQPYTKPTDTKQYIHIDSCHPKHVFKSLPYSQALRIKKLCTDENTLKIELNNLQGYFKNRGYNTKDIETGIKKALDNAQQQKTTKGDMTTMVITYHPNNPPFARILHKLYSEHQKELPGKLTRPIVAYRRTKNLKELLTRAKFSNPPAHKRREINDTNTLRTYPRPINTYDKSQMTAPIKHILMKCKCGQQQIFDEYTTLEEAIAKSPNKLTNCQGSTEHGLLAIPIKVTHQTEVLCNECNFVPTC